jgi:hypothetical protein
LGWFGGRDLPSLARPNARQSANSASRTDWPSKPGRPPSQSAFQTIPPRLHPAPHRYAGVRQHVGVAEANQVAGEGPAFCCLGGGYALATWVVAPGGFAGGGGKGAPPPLHLTSGGKGGPEAAGTGRADKTASPIAARRAHQCCWLLPVSWGLAKGGGHGRAGGGRSSGGVGGHCPWQEQRSTPTQAIAARAQHAN